MKPWEVLGQATIAGSGETIELSRRDTEYSLTLAGYELINNRVHGSKDAMAELACEVISQCREPNVLVAGLGMGFTLASALKHLPETAEVTVAEICPEVVQWNREYFAEFNGNPLADKRVTVKEMDAAEVIQTADRYFNAIILDVDNGPFEVFRKDNDWFYSNEGLSAAFQALRSSGVLAMWSRSRKGLLNRRLNFIGFELTDKVVRARNPKSGARHIAWMAQKPRRSKKTYKTSPVEK